MDKDDVSMCEFVIKAIELCEDKIKRYKALLKGYTNTLTKEEFIELGIELGYMEKEDENGKENV